MSRAIRLRPATAARLDALRKPGERANDVVGRALDALESAAKGSRGK